MNYIYTGNSAEILNTSIARNSIDLTITSPPYDTMREYNGFSFPFEDIAKGLYRVTKEGGVVVWVVGDETVKGSESGTSFKQVLFFMSLGFSLHDTMIYEKDMFTFPSKNRYHQIFEYMFVLSKGKPKTVNIIKDKRNIYAGNTIRGKVRNRDGTLSNKAAVGTTYTIPDFGARNNIWRYGNGKNKATNDEIAYKHPATFPEKLAADHILSWSNEGDIILDPMAGAGTVLKQAALLNRKFIGIDISMEYVDCVILPRLEIYNIPVLKKE